MTGFIFQLETIILGNGTWKTVIVVTFSVKELKILFSSLQDTSSNLNKVDKMLDLYRDHTDDCGDIAPVSINSLTWNLSYIILSLVSDFR